MSPFRNRSLLTKLNLIIALLLLFFFALSAVLNYHRQKQFVLDQSVEKARLVSFVAIHAREYVSNELLIGDVTLNRERYGLIPVVSSNRISQRVGAELGYHVRQVSTQYRNPMNAADPFESEVIEAFKADAGLREYYSQTDYQGAPVFRYLKPFKADQSCLECHAAPEDAPEFIRKLYPQEKDQSYNYQLGEVIGAVSIIIPVQELYSQIYDNLRNELFLNGAIFAALIALLAMLTRMAVTRPLARLGDGIAKIMRTGTFSEKIPHRGEDEIGRLIVGFNEMMSHLEERTRHLEESERRFSVLTETARDGIISFLKNGQVILFNREAERIFGYSKREVLGESVALFVHADCSSLGDLNMEEYLEEHAEGLTSQVQRVSGKRRDGSRLTLELSLSRAESDGQFFYTAILRNVT